ncbi:FAD-dependent oxidoreductase [Patescibacteria group bacterium]|nr:FAD-dependent oxidoreductase [Patescibacteria group bacterium]MBU2632931.1 FAD-dependent oxidoreductase [Patescibacteria group bacterium]
MKSQISKMVYDLIIIGADSAGLSAGIYAGRKQIKTLIISKKIGGQSVLANNIENYPGFLSVSGEKLISKMKKQVENFGVVIEEKEVVSIKKNKNTFIIETGEKKYESKTVIIATGRHWRSLNVPGENEFLGKGVSTCAICDAPFYSGKDVAVIGGGNSAFSSAYDLLKYASKVYILQHRENFIGDKSMHEKLEKSGKVEFLNNAETKEIRGTKFVESLVYEDIKSKQMKELKVGGVFVSIGQIPNSDFAESFLELNNFREIIIDCKTNETSVRGVFAAGDVTNVKYKQSIIAAGEGAKAALSVSDFLKGSGIV